MPADTDTTHDEAVRILDARLERAGRPPGDYTEREYLAALQEAGRGSGGPVPASVLERLGLTREETNGLDVIAARGEAILAEQGLHPGDYGLDECKQAVRLALAELPDDQAIKLIRAEGLSLSMERQAQLVDDAIAAGACEPERRTAVAAAIATDPVAYTIAAARLAHLDVTWVLTSAPHSLRTPATIYATAELRREAAKATSRNSGSIVTPDESGLRLHVRAEEIAVSNGWATRNVRGELEYTEPDGYEQALEQAEGERVAALEAEIVAAASWGEDTREIALRLRTDSRRVNAVLAAARQRAA